MRGAIASVPKDKKINFAGRENAGWSSCEARSLHYARCKRNVTGREKWRVRVTNVSVDVRTAIVVS